MLFKNRHYYMTYYMELLCNNFHYQSVKTITDWVYPCSNEITARVKHYHMGIFPEILFEECLFIVLCGSAVADFLFPIINKHSWNNISGKVHKHSCINITGKFLFFKNLNCWALLFKFNLIFSIRYEVWTHHANQFISS